MQKLTVFFIGATVMVVVSITAVLGYKYFERNMAKEPKQEIVQDETPVKEEKEEVIAEPEESEEPEVTEEDEPQGETDTPLIIESDNTSPYATIDESKLSKAGFDDPKLTLSPFSGTIFGNIDIKEYRDDEHISYLVMDNSEFAGTINELIFPNEEIANEVYASIKQKITDDENFIINETNQYGDLSFFSNHAAQKNSVFLVVKIYDRLYTLHYPAKNHNKMKNLIYLF